MQVALTLANDQFNNVLYKLSKLSKSLEQSLHEARQSEIEAYLNYKRFKAEIKMKK
ncbi:unnamed protein product (macronuclear) [Paramecium tetraurelia]|uniref:Uncharacterized protein n=1 Tax=Paramecium tetraurelia TaxID=5888 RepID=A0ECG1_PARTE|nr:uncharacterized protein GSPATT00003847001 [Paramecium tetraurelia]CAK92978.1 unnamed protein product [Paramecium tetraurelia]|eukprot:XP_001460375.1 hypothetical protein (macronuclear) [Paramecium tetraurelia strain d4-2]